MRAWVVGRALMLGSVALLALAVPSMAQPGPGATPGYAARQLPQGANPPDPIGGRGRRLQPGRAGGGQFMQRFQRANVSGDGHLTLDQARAGRMPFVTRHFDEIDATHKGYVTVDDLRAYRRRLAAQRRAAQGDAGPDAAPGAPGAASGAASGGDPDAADPGPQ